MSTSDLNSLRERWIHLYKEHLPGLAKARDPVQKEWPVYLDHCFARIVLDNAIGKGKPWMHRVRQPAVKNMTEQQVQKAVELAEDIATGEADLAELNERSLQTRGKRKAQAGNDTGDTKKRQRPAQQDEAAISKYFLPSPSPPSMDKAQHADASNVAPESQEEALEVLEDEEMTAQVQRIEKSDLTAFRKQTLKLLCQVPRGRYSTYQAMSDYITITSHKSCARAVGNAMRNNPFAPEVPCHRILAADGTLGGFCGHWGEEGKFANKKHALLHEEGVRFDARGKVKGPPFRDFHD
jgi:O-6-methylguanine DNA methyltransferase